VASVPLAPDERQRPLALGIERRERAAYVDVVESLGGEARRDGLVAPPAEREHLGAGARGTGVVGDACATQAREDVCGHRAGDASALEPLLEAARRDVPSRERPAGDVPRTSVHELPPHPPERRAIELEARREPRPNDDVVGHRPPRPSVDLERDPPRPRPPQRGQLRQLVPLRVMLSSF
jgi:hypothetical protein